MQVEEKMERKEGGTKGAPYLGTCDQCPEDKGLAFPSNAEDLYVPQLGTPEGQ